MTVMDVREIRHYTSGGAWVIEAPEEFDISAAPAVRELTIQLQDAGAAGIVIDLSPVTFMDNAALGVVVAAHDRFRRAERWLVVAAAREPVARKFEIAGLSKCLPMHPTAEGALAAALAAAAGR